MQCSDHTRRSLLLTAVTTAACLAAKPAKSEDDKPGSDERPQKGDLLVVSEGEHGGQVIKPDDLKVGGPPMNAFPKDPKTSVVRNGSRLNEILIVRIDPSELDQDTRRRSARGLWPIRRFVRTPDVPSPAG